MWEKGGPIAIGFTIVLGIVVACVITGLVVSDKVEARLLKKQSEMVTMATQDTNRACVEYCGCDGLAERQKWIDENPVEE